MDFEARKQKALAIMASRKMWKSNYAPLLIRLLWRLGIKGSVPAEGEMTP
ncbi:Uncharacterised protein [Klebsiella variicola]|nr:Uncharacterised protein [Klebsiella variicola]